MRVRYDIYMHRMKQFIFLSQQPNAINSTHLRQIWSLWHLCLRVEMFVSMYVCLQWVYTAHIQYKYVLIISSNTSPMYSHLTEAIWTNPYAHTWWSLEIFPIFATATTTHVPTTTELISLDSSNSIIAIHSCRICKHPCVRACMLACVFVSAH